MSEDHAIDLGLTTNERLDALRMPWYTASLTKLPKLSSAVILRGAKRIEAALQMIHDRGLVHADVKADNVFVDRDGSWHLGDYGSVVRVDEPVWSCTRVSFNERLVFSCLGACLRLGCVTNNTQVVDQLTRIPYLAPHESSFTFVTSCVLGSPGSLFRTHLQWRINVSAKTQVHKDRVTNLEAQITFTYAKSFRSLIQQWHPINLFSQPAKECFDWGLLVVLIVVQLTRPDWQRVMVEDNEGQDVPSIERIVDVCRRESHQELRSFLEELIARADWSAWFARASRGDSVDEVAQKVLRPSSLS